MADANYRPDARPAGAVDRIVDAADGFLARFRVPLSVASVAIFVLTCADYAGFVRLPSITLIDGMPGLIASGVYNAVWWGFLYPRAEARRASRAPQPDAANAPNSSKAKVDG